LRPIIGSPAMTKYLLPLCAALLLLPATASAAPVTTNDEGARVSDSAEVREIIFDKDDNVDGEVLKPGGANIGGRIAKEHASMIGIRGAFTAQLTRLANDI